MSKIVQFPKSQIDNACYVDNAEPIISNHSTTDHIGYISRRSDPTGGKNDWVVCNDINNPEWFYGFKTKQDAVDYLIEVIYDVKLTDKPRLDHIKLTNGIEQVFLDYDRKQCIGYRARSDGEVNWIVCIELDKDNAQWITESETCSELCNNFRNSNCYEVCTRKLWIGFDTRQEAREYLIKLFNEAKNEK